VRLTLVSVAVSVTLAFTMTAWVESVTVPTTVELTAWEKTRVLQNAIKKKSSAHIALARHRFFMSYPVSNYKPIAA
jgi:hypothetical protein